MSYGTLFALAVPEILKHHQLMVFQDVNWCLPRTPKGTPAPMSACLAFIWEHVTHLGLDKMGIISLLDFDIWSFPQWYIFVVFIVWISQRW